jgi:hypothetical protein
MVAVLLIAAAATLALCATAWAARGHEFAGSFGEPCPGEPCGPGQLKEPSAVAVSEATGDVYVLDEGDDRVERFSALGVYEGQFDGSGKFEVVTDAEPNKEGTPAPSGAFSFTGEAQTSGIAVDSSEGSPSSGDVYVVDSGHDVIDKFSASGEYLGQLTETSPGEVFVELGGVAVDSAGGLWVYQEGVVEGFGANGLIDGFSNALVNAFTGTQLVLTSREAFFHSGFAIDGKGDFYARGEAQHFEIQKYDHFGNLLSARVDDQNSSAVATDQIQNTVFIDNLSTVAAFNASGTELERLPVPGEHGAGLAVNASPTGPGSETLYVADSGENVIDRYQPQEPGPPSVESEGVSEITADSTSFEAELNPRGGATTYRFEYGPCTTPSTCSSSPYGHSAPVPDGALEAGFEIQTVSVHVSGLIARTHYHFRLSARNEAGGKANQVAGEEKTFITQGAGGEVTLPDARQWELVSPAEKFGSLVLPIEETGVVQASISGDAISYLANAPIEANPQGTYPGGTQILSTRGPKGWGSQNLSAPHEGTTGIPLGTKEWRFFTDDLSSSFLQPLGTFVPSISPEASESTAFLRSDYLNGNPDERCQPATMRCYRPLVTGTPGFANVPAGTVFGEAGLCPAREASCGPRFQDATPDGAHAVLSSRAALSETPIEGEARLSPSLYAWSAEAPPAEQLQLLSVLPEGQPAVSPKLGRDNHDTRGALSSDGTRIMWEAGPESERPQRSLYMRDTARGETIQLDKAEAQCEGKGECESRGGRFQMASGDGSRVLFTDAHRLRSDAGQPGLQSKEDLYECQLVKGAGGKDECQLTDLTPEAGGESADVQGLLPGASADASWVYFVANGVLSSQPDSEGEQARAGQCSFAGTLPAGATCNLYALHEGQVKLVSVLAGEDRHDWSTALRQMPTRVSPNGQWLEFMSQRSLTGYDNRDAKTGQPDAEVYLYNAASDHLACASCEPSGARPVGIEYHKLEPGSGGLAGGPRDVWESTALVAANVPGWTGADETGLATRHQPAYLNNEGRLYFNSADGLAPQDVNATEDVYQYEPPEVGSCSSESANFAERSGGCVDLISSGASSQESAFLDASASGGDIFFLTSAKLAPQDRDSAIDVYDAHSCSAASPCPSAEATTPPPCDTGDSCKPAPTPQPEIFGAPASALFSGAGNLPPPVGTPAPPVESKLTKALKSCRKRFPHAKKRRVSCEAKARRQFGAKKASSKKHPAKKRSSAKKSSTAKHRGSRR